MGSGRTPSYGDPERARGQKELRGAVCAALGTQAGVYNYTLVWVNRVRKHQSVLGHSSITIRSRGPQSNWGKSEY